MNNLCSCGSDKLLIMHNDDLSQCIKCRRFFSKNTIIEYEANLKLIAIGVKNIEWFEELYGKDKNIYSTKEND